MLNWQLGSNYFHRYNQHGQVIETNINNKRSGLSMENVTADFHFRLSSAVVGIFILGDQLEAQL